MTWLDRAEQLIKKHEGLRLKPYRDSRGILTIGYGHNLEKGISQRVAEVIFQEDFDEALLTAGIVAQRHGVNFHALPERICIVLADMAFNLGYKLDDFKRMWEAIRERDWKRMAEEMRNSRWYEQVGLRAKENIEIVLREVKE